MWIVSYCLFSQMNTEYKSISVSHIYTECLTDAVHLMAACPSGSRDCQDFFLQLSHQMYLRRTKKLLQNARGSQLWQVYVCCMLGRKMYVKTKISTIQQVYFSIQNFVFILVFIAEISMSTWFLLFVQSSSTFPSPENLYCIFSKYFLCDL